MLGKKQTLFAYPETQMLKFNTILEHIYTQPFIQQRTTQTIKVNCSYNQKSVSLAVHAHILQKGEESTPVIIYLPWYGGKSAQSRRYFNSKRHSDWTHVGIDIFNTKKEFSNILTSAVVSQHAYALVMRMMAEQVRLAHKAGKRVGIVGISYGANVLSAYTTKGLELPDAIVAVEGGSILQITLQTKYKGHNSDARSLHAINQEPDLLPVQSPLTGMAAYVSAVAINPSDKIVLGQQELWQNASKKMYIRGTHVTALLLNRSKIVRFAHEHLEQLLIPRNS